MAHLLRSLSHDFIEDRQLSFFPVTNGNRTTEKFPLQRNVYKLTRRSNRRGVTTQYHAVGFWGQFLLMNERKSCSLHRYFPPSACQAIVPFEIVSRHLPNTVLPVKGELFPID